MDFGGKTAVVTGAARGIGRRIAQELVSRGASCAVVDLALDDASTAAREISVSGGKAEGYGCDVSSFEQVSATAEAIVADFGEVDFLVNNAGIVKDRLLVRMTPEEWRSVIDVNLTGAFNFTKVLAPSMLKRRSGRIVNISSVIGLMGNAGQANYAASKAGLIGFTKSIAKEFASRGVTANAVAPGFIETAMTEALGEEVKVKMLEAIPLGRFGSPLDVANVVLFLLSDQASYLTGQVIHCDGGMVMDD